MRVLMGGIGGREMVDLLESWRPYWDEIRRRFGYASQNPAGPPAGSGPKAGGFPAGLDACVTMSVHHRKVRV